MGSLLQTLHMLHRANDALVSFQHRAFGLSLGSCVEIRSPSKHCLHLGLCLMPCRCRRTYSNDLLPPLPVHELLLRKLSRYPANRQCEQKDLESRLQ